MTRGTATIVLALLFACGDDGAAAAGTESGTASGSGGPSSTGPTSGTATGTGGGTDSGSSTSSGGGSSGGSSTTGGGGDPELCPPLPPARGATVTIDNSQITDIPTILGGVGPGTTVLLADGVYDLSGGGPIHITNDDVTVRSESGDRDAVVLDGGYAVGEVFLVAASNFTLADLTVRRAMWHPIHVTGGDSADTTGTRIYNVKVLDPGQQAIKINASGQGHYTDDGEIACSHVEMTDAGRPMVTDCYTGGIDAHSARGWIVRDNYFEGFWCAQGLSEHAVHFWVTGRDTVVERNHIVDCARGVGFGLGAQGNGNERVYADDPCPEADYLGHVDGVIRNNFIFGGRPELFASASGMDSGVALEQACGALVQHNTVVALEPPFVSMEYRFPNTDARIENNLVTHQIVERDGGQAGLAGNMEMAALTEVSDAMSGDLHLATDAAAIDAGVSSADPVADDFDGEPRRDGSPDVGADEVGS